MKRNKLISCLCQLIRAYVLLERNLLSWPDRPAIEKYLTTQLEMTAAQRQEWCDYFENLPAHVDDIPEAKKFKWLLPQYAKVFQERRGGPSSEALRVGESERPEKPDERVIWAQYKRADYNRDQKQREENYAREQHALQERIRSERLAAGDDEPTSEAESSSSSQPGPSTRAVQPRQHRRPLPQRAPSTRDSDSEIDSPSRPTTHASATSSSACDSSDDSSLSDTAATLTLPPRKRRPTAPFGTARSIRRGACLKLSLGDSGIVEVGDVVLFNPDPGSQATDRANGYTLGLCMGKVLEVDASSRLVNLWWLFGKEWTSKAHWKFWRSPGTSQKYTDWVDAESLLVTSFGTLAKITLVSLKREIFTLDRKSVSIVQDVISTND
jgi:hypothetical protein